MELFVHTTDFYEAVYYLTRGMHVEKIDVFQELGEERLCMTLSGEGIAEAQRIYLDGKATVNLHVFRRSYQHLRTLVIKAKKDFRRSEYARKGGVL